MERDKNAEIGLRIAKLREEMQLSQADLAAKLGYSRELITKFENGTRSLKIDSACSMASFFGVTTDYLFGLSPVRETNPDIQTAAKTTGLSEDALKVITHMLPQEVRALNMLLLSVNFQNSLSYLDDFRKALYTVEAMTKSGHLNTQFGRESVERCDLKEYYADSQFRFVLQEIRRKVKEEVDNDAQLCFARDSTQSERGG